MGLYTAPRYMLIRFDGKLWISFYIVVSGANHEDRYRGTQPITSLSVYPIKFDPSFAVLKQNLLSQGKKFLELTTPLFAHKMLVGKTLDEPVEEVRDGISHSFTLLNFLTKFRSMLKS